jgi:MFS transporter, FSR family, fosmidomycin resistance protein
VNAVIAPPVPAPNGIYLAAPVWYLWSETALVSRLVTRERKAAVTALAAVSVTHFLNDMLQAVLPAIYPVLKSALALDFAQIGTIALVYQVTASLLQPAIGHFADQRAMPLALPLGMTFTLAGMLLLSRAASYPVLLGAAVLVGLGSAVFHPEASRAARQASRGHHGLAQSIFQVGGNAGSATGPLLAALVVAPGGQGSIAWFSVIALLGIAILYKVGRWSTAHRLAVKSTDGGDSAASLFRDTRVRNALLVLMLLVFTKYLYQASLTNFYTFFLIERFGVSVQRSQLFLFLFLAAIALGTFIGGPVGDRIGRKRVIWWSILGVLPFSLLMPFANLFWTAVLSVMIGVILASAFSAALVYAQDLVPGRVGLISGLFFGFAFGMAGVSALILGYLADHTSVSFVYKVCAFVPALGVLAGLLPDVRPHRTVAW